MANSLIGHNIFRSKLRPLVPMSANGAGDVRIVQYATLNEEVAGVANLVSELIAQGASAGDILILTQSRAFGNPLYEAMVARGVPSKSYYAESELNDIFAKRSFALLKLFADRQDRVALRWLVGVNGNNLHAAGYRRVRDHCENTGTSPWDAMVHLESGALTLPHTSDLTMSFREIQKALEGLETLPDLNAVVSQLFPEGQSETRDIRELALAALIKIDGGDRRALVRELVIAISNPEIPTEIQEVRIMSWTVLSTRFLTCAATV